MDWSGTLAYLEAFGTTQLIFPYLAASLAAFDDHPPEIYRNEKLKWTYCRTFLNYNSRHASSSNRSNSSRLIFIQYNTRTHLWMNCLYQDRLNQDHHNDLLFIQENCKLLTAKAPPYYKMWHENNNRITKNTKYDGNAHGINVSGPIPFNLLLLYYYHLFYMTMQRTHNSTGQYEYAF